MQVEFKGFGTVPHDLPKRPLKPELTKVSVESYNKIRADLVLEPFLVIFTADESIQEAGRPQPLPAEAQEEGQINRLCPHYGGTA